MKSRKPTTTTPITPSTRATMSGGSREEARVHSVSMNTHSRIEPSWLPQVAATR